MGSPPPAASDEESGSTKSQAADASRRHQKRQLEIVSARTAVATFGACAPRLKATADEALLRRQRRTSSVGLPRDVLELVMKQLAVPDQVRGARAVLQDLASARLACWELHDAGQCAVPCLVAALPPLPLPSEGAAGWWDALVQNPTSFTVAELKQAARMLNAPVSGTKPELILRILHSFGLQQPSAMPAALCMALCKERTAPLHPHVVARLRDMAWRGHLLAGDALKQTDAACMRRLMHAFVHGQDDLLRMHRAWLKAARQPLCRYCGQAGARRCCQQLCGVCCKLLQQRQDAAATACTRHVLLKNYGSARCNT